MKMEEFIHKSMLQLGQGPQRDYWKFQRWILRKADETLKEVMSDETFQDDPRANR